MKAKKLIAIVTGLLTLLLAVFSFTLSFNALSDLAQVHGVSIPPLFPFVVEFSVVIFSLNALYRSLNGQSARVQWALIIGSSCLAGLFNVAHAQPDVISRLMAAMPSLFLLLSFESFLSLVKSEVGHRAPIGLNEPLELVSELVNEPINELVSERQAKVFELHGQGVKQVQMAHRLGVSVSTIKRDMVAMNGSIK